jgi:protein arginine N-methyltransferase 1
VSKLKLCVIAVSLLILDCSSNELAANDASTSTLSCQYVVTNSVPILNIDLQHCTEDDLSFTSPFQLRAQRNDNIHSFVAYFECAFTRVHKPLGFSTSPFSKYTHWKQTIFYLKDRITICEGEEITGTIACRPNKKNTRDLDISFDINFHGMHSTISNEHVEYRLR